MSQIKFIPPSISEYTFVEIIKDAVNGFEDVGFSITDNLAFAAELNGCNKKFIKKIQRTVHKLIQEMHIVNS